MTVATASQVPSVGVASSGGHARTRSRVVNRAGCRQVVRARVGMEGQEFQSRRGMLFGVSQRTPATRETRSEGLSLGQIVTLADTDEAMAMEEGDEKPKFSTDLFPKPLKQAASVVITPLFFFYLWQRLQRRVEMSKTNQRDLLRKGRKGDKYIVQVPEDMKSKTKVDAEGKPVPVKKATPKSPSEAFIGAILSGIIAYGFYRAGEVVITNLDATPFPTNNWTAQRISVTVRTIISGLCYLSISVFAFNSIGLFLYSGQLLMNPEEEEDSPPKTESEGEDATE